MTEAAKGTVQDGDLVYTLNGEEYRTPIKTIRGDYKQATGCNTNKLRRWEKQDFIPCSDDIFQERLYAIQWITKETLSKSRQETFFAAVIEDDCGESGRWRDLPKNLAQWQEEGLVPDMAIESGYKTVKPIRKRGWTYWHHLFSSRNY